MTAERDPERIVRSWLEVGATALPDHLLDAVLDQLPATPQRRSSWPSRRFAQMHTNAKLALGAVAIVLVAVAGFAILPRNGGVGGPGATPTPIASPTPTGIPLTSAELNRTLAAATYHTATGFAAPFTVTLPAGWSPSALNVGETSLIGPVNQNDHQPYIGAFIIERVSVDPCRESPDASASPAPPAGRPVGSAAEIVAALGAMPGFQIGPVSNVTVDGYPALRVDLTNTVDGSVCVAEDFFPIWTERGGIPVATNPRTTQYLWVVDRPSGPVLLAGEVTELKAEDLATIESIVESIDFD